MKSALISVWTKEGIENYAKELIDLGYEIISTKGTCEYLKNFNINAKSIDEITNFEPLFDGRVKTLHPIIFGGILYKRNNLKHQLQAKEKNIPNIEIVIVDLYPFSIASKDVIDEEELFEFIDIGGISLIRASAKNYKDVIIIVDLDDLDWVIEKIKKNSLTIEDRKKLALKGFYKSADYDSFIYNELLRRWQFNMYDLDLIFSYRIGYHLRYGENPHQKASLLFNNYIKGFAQALDYIWGKELSYNNLLDSFSAYSVVMEFNEKACAIVKHNNPCGVAIGSNEVEIYKKAYESDRLSAYGGIIAFNFEVNDDLAKLLNENFYEVIIANGYTQKALDILKEKKNRRILKINNYKKPNFYIRDLGGDLLICEEDYILYNELNVVSGDNLTEDEKKQIEFGIKVIKHIKSNAILLLKNFSTVGIGAGQMSRIDALKVAIMKAGEKAKGSILISDAFFPFPDSIELAYENGIYLIVEPGGSIRDNEVINKAKEYNIKLVFTGIRHFRH
ncbi:MAG: bifunctional phosphoribosylaminoimidazolecarboxamide formyltransferase/IMP cyclohydrolase [candidate division WOR-3 bacterium]